MSDVYLAWSPGGESRHTFTLLPPEIPELNLLVSFVYLQEFSGRRYTNRFGKMMLDSGAFSAWKSGKVIDMAALVAETRNPRWDESVTLDVIGNGPASLDNALRMKAMGSPAYPVFHYGESWDILDRYREEFWKVGLSCRFGEPSSASYKWIAECFRRAWPYRFHSFGWVAPDLLKSYPFHSADTASWVLSPSTRGQWRAFGGKMSVRGSKKNLRAEMEVYFRLQRELKSRWARTLAELPPVARTSGASPTPPPASST